jgi:hypothetical protein
MLVCHHDALMAVCSAKCLNLAMDIPLPWVFHDDGSLTAADRTLFFTQFPGCVVVDRPTSDARCEELAEEFPTLPGLRQKYVMLVKLLDLYLFSDRPRILYVDSDVLFIRHPEFLLERLRASDGPNFFNRDIWTNYVASIETIATLTGVELPERLNAGLSVLHREDILPARVAEVLAQLDFSLRTDWTYYYGHMLEQTVVAVVTASGRHGVKHLPVEYDLTIDGGGLDSIVTRHYVGVIRDQYECEGLRFLTERSSFHKRWKSFVAQHASAGRN